MRTAQDVVEQYYFVSAA